MLEVNYEHSCFNPISEREVSNISVGKRVEDLESWR